MLSTKDISQRISDAYGKRERLTSTLGRHTAMLEKKEREFEKKYKLNPNLYTEETLRGNELAYWDFFSINSKKEDIRSVTKKIQDMDERIEKLKADLRSAETQQAFMDNEIPDVIKEFFEAWKQDSISFFSNRYDEYHEFVQQLRTEEYAARREAVKTLPVYSKYADRIQSMSDYDFLNVYPRQPMESYLKERSLDYNSISERKRSFAGPVVTAMCRYNDPIQRQQHLEADMEREMRSRMLDLAQRIGEHVGKITDAQGLHIQNGEIAGVIYGEKGSATIQTIGAGGYNIQRFHFRTLVHPIEQYETQQEQPDSDEDEDCDMGM
ncbi:MAG: hypothetical protein J6A19_10095 [Oscillospiraceae bacterium]|nr:hypothetical protein [Oscillospiraceae bacterium]